MLASPAKKAEGIARGCSGTIAADGTAVTLTLGFNPVHIELVNVTDTIKWQKIAGMAANACLKITGVPAVTVDATSAILFNGDGTVTISAAAAPAGKSLVFFAE